MTYDDYQAMTFARRGRVLTVTLDRPDQRNAVNAAMHDDLSRVFGDVMRDDATEVVVLTGAGRAFCAGGDMPWLMGQIEDPAKFRVTQREAKQIIFAMLDCEKPIIARVNGHAIGLGATLALFCDIIIAAEEARIGDPHVGVGLVAGDGGAIIWPQLIGYARAKEYLMTGDLMTATEAARIGLINHAARIGLINHAVPAAELDAKVYDLAERLAGGATMAIRWTKTAANIGLKQLAHSILDASLAYEALTNQSADHREAVTAFIEKRKPKFSGT